MRKPVSDPLAWWRQAVYSAHPAPAAIDDPQPGYYRRKLVKGGPWVAVRIWLVEMVDKETGELTADSYLCCDVDGKPADPNDQWSYCCDQAITIDDYNHMMRVSRYAKARDPREPLARPNQKIDLMTVPFPTFTQPKGKKT